MYMLIWKIRNFSYQKFRTERGLDQPRTNSRGRLRVVLSWVFAAIFGSAHMVGYAEAISADSKVLAQGTPIADVHMHLYKGLQPEDLLSAMDRNNVRWGGGVGPVGPGYDPMDFVRLLGKRYFPAGAQAEYHEMFMAGGEREMANPNSAKFKALVETLKTQFEKKEISGIGELILNNHQSTAMPGYRRKVPIDSEPFQILFRLAEQYQGYVQVHMDDDSDSIAEISKMATSFPSVPIILAHCVSRSSSATAQKLLEAHANLYCETSYRSTSRNNAPALRSSMIHTDTSAVPEWIAVINKFPDRFMVGSDIYTKDVSYDSVLGAIRSGLLPELAPEVLKKVAYENAQRIFKLEPLVE
jgi:Tat protein secretion system quality control protein TatD with DNase activity